MPMTGTLHQRERLAPSSPSAAKAGAGTATVTSATMTVTKHPYKRVLAPAAMFAFNLFSIFEKFIGFEQRAQRQARFAEVRVGALVAVYHREHQHHLAAGILHRLDRLDCRAAGGGDILDDDDAFALQAFTLGEPLDREPCAEFFRILADEESGDRLALLPRELGDGAGKRYRAHLKPADVIDVLALEGIERQFRQKCSAFRIEHGRLEGEVEIALAPRSEGDLAAAERAGADDVGQTGAGGGGGHGQTRYAEEWSGFLLILRQRGQPRSPPFTAELRQRRFPAEDKAVKLSRCVSGPHRKGSSALRNN